MTLKKYSIAKNDDIYEAFPDVVLTNNNRLIVVFLECKHHSDRSYTRVMITKSDDRGKTWTKKEGFTDPWYKKDGSWNCPRISKLKDGRLVVICDKIDEFGSGKARNYYWIGDESGESFGEAILSPATGIVPDQLIETSNGRWIVSTHKKIEKNLAQCMWYSDDMGKSWSDEIIIANEPGLLLCEGSIVEVKENTLVCFLRENSFRGLDGYKCISYDNGETWEGVYTLPVPGVHRPVAGKLKSGTFMITHRFMQGGKGWIGYWTQNIFATFMNEKSLLAKERSEQSSRIMPLDFDRSSVSDVGYSGWVQFDDGLIYVVYYIVDDSPNGQIRGISFTEDDVIIGGFSE